ncbi:hypothetical protein BDV34DRAFT_196748 [Aspergillus parasiticus]|uniref:Uncharacterized protein n=1 Tax=Aspergillus parasiticus TaxID=5067 RepID=A0A5N6DK10_ASPPA|nr:hypothetical protein BDV34DRAFT_196748 [Aspergillus parasiticus]
MMSMIDQMLFRVIHALHRDDLVLTRYGSPFRAHFRVVVYLRYGTFRVIPLTVLTGIASYAIVGSVVAE